MLKGSKDLGTLDKANAYAHAAAVILSECMLMKRDSGSE